MPTALQEYQQRLTTPEDAVQLLQSDTNIALGVALNQPPAGSLVTHCYMSAKSI